MNANANQANSLCCKSVVILTLLAALIVPAIYTINYANVDSKFSGNYTIRECDIITKYEYTGWTCEDQHDRHLYDGYAYGICNGTEFKIGKICSETCGGYRENCTYHSNHTQLYDFGTHIEFKEKFDAARTLLADTKTMRWMVLFIMICIIALIGTIILFIGEHREYTNDVEMQTIDRVI